EAIAASDLDRRGGPESEKLREAEALVIRTMTRIDAEFLARAPKLRFVGSASAGFDHVDLEALASAGIAFAHAPGCSARAVGEWVVAATADATLRDSAPSALRAWAEDPRARLRVGVVGCGAVGREVAHAFEAMGAELWLCDPP